MGGGGSRAHRLSALYSAFAEAPLPGWILKTFPPGPAGRKFRLGHSRVGFDQSVSSVLPRPPWHRRSVPPLWDLCQAVLPPDIKWEGFCSSSSSVFSALRTWAPLRGS